MYACSPESQSNPGLHAKKCGQQVEGGDSPPLLHFHETPPGILHLVLGSPVQDLGPAKTGPKEGHEIIIELKHLSYGDRLKQLRLFRLEKAPERPYCSLSILEAGL